MDEPEKKRPNAEYPLLKTNDDGKELVFYYSRERRLENASQEVQDLYKGSPRKKSGFFRSLTSTKPLAFLFVSILILSAMIMVISSLGLADSSRTLGGNRLTVSAIRFDGATFFVLTKTYKEGTESYTGLVDIAVSPVVKESEGEYPVFNHRVFFSLSTEEDYRFSVPFEAEAMILVLQGETGLVNFTVKPK
ncbi:MAG: hypothetical protein LBN21_08185 [Treponema sp.]|nr:hypothetical protein [Treponema sp.]